MANANPQPNRPLHIEGESTDSATQSSTQSKEEQKPTTHILHTVPSINETSNEPPSSADPQLGASGARGTAAMDPHTRQEVARKGGLAVSRNKQHMAEIGRKGGQSVSRNREHMAKIGRKGGAASRSTRSSSGSSDESSGSGNPAT